MITWLILAFFFLLVVWLSLRFTHKLYPDEPLTTGGEVNIYMDGVFNRTAVITRIHPTFIVIYDQLPLPVHFRGKFYATGYTNDGYHLMFVGRKRLFFLARIAELIRKIANTPECQVQEVDDNPATESETEKEDVSNG